MKKYTFLLALLCFLAQFVVAQNAPQPVFSVVQAGTSPQGIDSFWVVSTIYENGGNWFHKSEEGNLFLGKEALYRYLDEKAATQSAQMKVKQDELKQQLVVSQIEAAKQDVEAAKQKPKSSSSSKSSTTKKH